MDAQLRKVVDLVAQRVTGSVFAPRCRDCGVQVELNLDRRGGRVRLSVDHPLPLCPEFARAVEDVEPIS